ncbi:MAG: N-6 DNA methylase [Acidobacteriia bacterium]|nr:N-6 DNA methylase [Terriglobia bacterium]
MHLSGVLTLNGIPTVYLRDEPKPVTPQVTAEIHRQFWNQGVPSILLLRDPVTVRVFSSMTKPVNPATATGAEVEDRLVEEVNLATLGSWAPRFYVQLGTGHYYAGDRQAKFDPEQTVDAYLLSNLGAVRDALVDEGLTPQFAHAFLGRLLFTCYLCDRGIVNLSDYFKAKPWRHLHELLAGLDNPAAALYDTLYPALKRDFNGSMFDDELIEEHRLVRASHFEVVRRFLAGDDIAKGQGQRSLGFWAYDFKFIPVETISSIYENFLEKEDEKGKRAAGAFYTPRLLAETALDVALEHLSPLYSESRRFLDPACGSGIFLVLLFNRMAAEWRAAQKVDPTPQVRAEALLSRLDTLRGVDKNPTACRIACFSLYLAFLDQFEPPGVRAYKLHTGKKLPNLLHLKGAKRPEHPVVREADFREIAPQWPGQFDLVIGNPPWSGRGTKQLAQEFMEKTPALLTDTGRVCLLLPSKVFLNQTDAFQSRWLRSVTLEKLIQLADYSFILFKESLCPCNIALFAPRKPDEATHEIEYLTPKVSCADLRDGVISVSPKDRKWIPLRFVLAAAEQESAGIAWKSNLWGTPRDLKFLDYLFSFPRLHDLAGSVEEWRLKKRRWRSGVGFKPRTSAVETPKPLRWSPRDRVVSPKSIAGLPALPEALTHELGPYLSDKGYPINELGREPAEEIFTPPLVLWNDGFTSAAFFDYKVRYQHALHSISGLDADGDYLRFLTCFLRSPLARYFVFHTAASLATERDKVHNSEALRLPFFLPDSEAARPDAARIVSNVAAKMRRFSKEMEDSAKILLKRIKPSRPGRLFDDDRDEDAGRKERNRWLQEQRGKAERLQAELNPLIYKYFGVSTAECALVEDTVEVFDHSDTPASFEAARNIPTLQPLDAAGLEPYASMLTNTLNGWASGGLRVLAVGGVDAELGLGLVELRQTRTPREFRTCDISKVLATALEGLEDANIEHWGRFEFRRSGLIFHGAHIYLLKRAVRGEWTRTAALNDAVELSAHIAAARRQAKTG